MARTKNTKRARASDWPAYVSAGPFLFVSAQYYASQTIEEVEREHLADAPPAGDAPWVSRMEGPVSSQALKIYGRYKKLLAREGGTLNSLVRYHIFQRNKRFFPVFDRIRRHYEAHPPASTAVGVGRFHPDDLARLCVDAIAIQPDAIHREVLGGSGKYDAAAHFSHVIGAGPYLFLAGQIPVDTSKPGAPLIRGYDDIPEEGRFLKVGRSHEDARNGPIAAQTWFTYDLVRHHLKSVGSSLEHVLNLTVYLQDMRDFPTFHRVHERFFPANPPALTVVEVAEVGHKGTLIEIEATAILPGTGITRRGISPRGWIAPAQFTPLVEAGGLAFLSGLVGTDEWGAPIDSVNALPLPIRRKFARRQALARNPVALQAAAILSELQAQLIGAGHTLERIVQLTVFIDDITQFASVSEQLAEAFGARRPALTVIESAHPAPLSGARLSMTAIAWTGSDEPQYHFV